MSRPSRFPHNGLVDLRRRSGLTQRGLAHILGINESIVGLWEKSRYPVPNNRYADLACALGCTEAEVVAATSVGAKPTYIDPACPNDWRLLDEDSRDGQARWAAWMEAEAALVVSAAQTRYNARYGRRVTA